MRNGRKPFIATPKFNEIPKFAPLYGCRDWKVLGALQLNHKRYQCRVRVWPAGGERECSGGEMALPPVEFVWRLALQPVKRPACYEADPQSSALISSGPPWGGCWLADAIEPDERWGHDSPPAVPTPPTPPGRSLRVPADAASLERALRLPALV